jgi:hypothetical protein
MTAGALRAKARNALAITPTLKAKLKSSPKSTQQIRAAAKLEYTDRTERLETATQFPQQKILIRRGTQSTEKFRTEFSHENILFLTCAHAQKV